MRPLFVSALASAFTLAPSIAAQQNIPAPRPAIAQAASDLRQLVTAQEAYFAANGRYAADPALTTFKSSTGNTVRLIRPEPNRYAAELTGPGFDGSCVIHVGLGSGDLPRTVREHKVFPEGDPACDGDGELEEPQWAASAVMEVQQVLADIAKRQERRFGRSGAYTAALEELEGLRPNRNVTVLLTVSAASERTAGFLATASHTRYPNSSCIVRSGFGAWMRTAMTKSQRLRPSFEIQVVCDDFKR